MTTINIPLALAQAAYTMAWMVEDIAITTGNHELVADAALTASDLLDAISAQAGPIAAEEAIPKYRRGINPPLGN